MTSLLSSLSFSNHHQPQNALDRSLNFEDAMNASDASFNGSFGSTNSAPPSAAMEMHPNDYAELLKLPGNDACMDCGSTKGNKFASVSFGILLCTKCSGAHRSLGAKISWVRSIKHDHWSRDHLTRMRRGGNERFLAYLDVQMGFDFFQTASIKERYTCAAAQDYQKALAAMADAQESYHNQESLQKLMQEHEQMQQQQQLQQQQAQPPQPTTVMESAHNSASTYASSTNNMDTEETLVKDRSLTGDTEDSSLEDAPGHTKTEEEALGWFSSLLPQPAPPAAKSTRAHSFTHATTDDNSGFVPRSRSNSAAAVSSSAFSLMGASDHERRSSDGTAVKEFIIGPGTPLNKIHRIPSTPVTPPPTPTTHRGSIMELIGITSRPSLDRTASLRLHKCLEEDMEKQSKKYQRNAPSTTATVTYLGREYDAETSRDAAAAAVADNILPPLTSMTTVTTPHHNHSSSKRRPTPPNRTQSESKLKVEPPASGLAWATNSFNWLSSANLITEDNEESDHAEYLRDLDTCEFSALKAALREDGGLTSLCVSERIHSVAAETFQVEPPTLKYAQSAAPRLQHSLSGSANFASPDWMRPQSSTVSDDALVEEGDDSQNMIVISREED